MKVICFISLITYIFIVTSCEENNDNSAIKYEDIGVRTNYNANNVSNPSYSIQITDTAFSLTNLKIKVDKVMALTTSEFLDRFENSKHLKRLLITSNDSIYFKTWTYKDSTDTFNAFYNLLDCFGINCISIDLYSTDFLSPAYNLLFVSKNQIHWISSKSNQDKLVWQAYLKTEYQRPSYHFIVEQKRNRNIVWLEENIFRPNTFNVLNSNL